MLKEDGKHYFRMSDGDELCLDDLLVPIRNYRSYSETEPTGDEYLDRANRIVELMFDTEEDEAMGSLGEALRRVGSQRRGSLRLRGKLWEVAEPILDSTQFNRVASGIGVWRPETITAIARGLSEWGGEFEAWIIRDRFLRERSFNPEQRHSLLNSVVNLGGINAAIALEIALKQTAQGQYRYDSELISLIDDSITGGSADITESVDRAYGRRLLAAHRNDDGVVRVEKALKDLSGRLGTQASWTLELFK